MASVIILVYGESRHLVPKPADYDGLINVARTNFPELYDVDLDSIAIHFTPEWFDSEVKLDRGAFAEVNNRAVLRIATTSSALAQYPDFPPFDQYPGGPSLDQYSGNDGNYQGGDVADQHSCIDGNYQDGGVADQQSGNDSNYQGGGVADHHSGYQPGNGRLTLCVVHVPTDRKVWLSIQPHTRLCRLMARAAAFVGVDQFDYDFEYQGQILEDDDTAQSKGMEHEDVIEMWSWV